MIAAHVALSLRLNLRNRLAMIYGFLFPLIFLFAFWAIYRHDEVPLAAHMGAILTVTILGGACFGLPTALVAERERGVWRRYRATPVPPAAFLASALVTRFVLLLAAGLLQLGVALAVGMPVPTDPAGLLVAFAAASVAFLGLGLLIAMLADSVPAVQALGQCIFLPMLMVGGVAVPLSSLPDWAQRLSAFFPGRYAVAALQAGVTGAGVRYAAFELGALVLIGLAASIAAVRLFRWDSGRSGSRAGRGWVLLALAMWVAVGVAAERRGEPVVREPEQEQVPQKSVLISPAPTPPAPSNILAPDAGFSPEPTWRDVTDAQIARVAFDRLPPDEGLVAPIALTTQAPDEAGTAQYVGLRAGLADWSPARATDPVQRARNLLCVAAVPDLLRIESIERFAPVAVYERLRADLPARDLPRILYWIAEHPEEGDMAACRQLEPLGLPAIDGPTDQLRPRVMLYALKLLGRLTGAIVQR